MTATKQLKSAEGTADKPNFHAGPSDVKDDVQVRIRYYTYRAAAGLVAGANTIVTFTIERPASDVWPHFKDFTSWQSSYGHYYSGVAGDLEGKPMRLSAKPNDPGLHQYQVIRVLPEYLIVLDQPVPQPGYEGLQWWLGGVSAGFHLFMLDEQRGKTVATVFMNHASVMEQSSATQNMTEEEALRPWRAEEMAPEWLRKWRDDFIPSLKRLVDQDRLR